MSLKAERGLSTNRLSLSVFESDDTKVDSMQEEPGGMRFFMVSKNIEVFYFASFAGEISV